MIVNTQIDIYNLSHGENVPAWSVKSYQVLLQNLSNIPNMIGRPTKGDNHSIDIEVRFLDKNYVLYVGVHWEDQTEADDDNPDGYKSFSASTQLEYTKWEKLNQQLGRLQLEISSKAFQNGFLR